MTHYLVAHCPTFGCYARVPVVKLDSETRPDFDLTMQMVVLCPNCQKEFYEPATSLDWSQTAN